VRYTRNNQEVRPFEAGGEASLERFARKADAGLFVVGSHSKKRPHNLTLGRMYDGQLYDMLEVGVSSHTPIAEFKGAAFAQAGNKVGLWGRARPGPAAWGGRAAACALRGCSQGACA
jgi:ribosome production factor 2